MTTNTKALHEELQKLVKDMREISDLADGEGRSLTEDENQRWDTINNRVSELEADIDRKTRLAELDSIKAAKLMEEATEKGIDQEQVIDTQKAYKDAWLKHLGGADLEPDERKILRGGFSKETRAQNVGTDSEGGYLVPTDLFNEIIVTMAAYAGIRDCSRLISTSAGNTMTIPTNNDTANEATLLAESTQVSEQDTVLAEVQLDAYKYTSKLIRVSSELMQDSAFNTEQFIIEQFGERFGRGLNAAWTTGTGSSQPQGVTVGAAAGATTASETAFTLDEVINLIHSVDPAYRTNGKLMMHDSILKAARKLKDGDSRYLWEPAVQAGEASTLFGYDVVVNQKMASTQAASAKIMVFGDFSKFFIREVQGIVMRRLVERYADYDQVGLVGFMRTDSVVVDSAGLKLLTNGDT